MIYENFLALRAQSPQLYEYGAAAERYIHSDPHTAIIKLRCFVETLVGGLYRRLGLPSDAAVTLFELLQGDSFRAVIPGEIVQKMHAIRMLGNKAAHGGDVDSQAAIALLKEAYLLGRWMHESYSGQQKVYTEFRLPPAPDSVAVTVDSSERLVAKTDLARLEKEGRAERASSSQVHPEPDDTGLYSFRDAAFGAAARLDLAPEATRRLMRIQDAFAESRLTEGQQELVDRLDQFLTGSADNVFLLKGYAGTGKTFITKGLTEYFRAIGRNYVLAAPTGKASKVIAKKTRSPAYTVHKTIYSFKDVVEYRDDDLDGTETYKFYAQLNVNEMSADTVFIVDEASMFSDVYQEAEFFRTGSGHLLRDFFKYVNLDHNDHRKKVIFIGDDAQLPPVGMNFSPALDAGYLRREYDVKTTSHELTQVVRQKADSGVMRNALQLRTALKEQTFNRLVIALDRPDVTKIDHENLVAAYLDSCAGKINGESIVIAYSNADVTAYNRRIRQHFFPDCLEVMVGDKLMATSNSNAFGFFISNGDFGLVKQVSETSEVRQVILKRKNPDTQAIEKIEVALRFRDVTVGFKDLDDSARFFRAKIHENLLYGEHASLSSDENKALYLDFCLRHQHVPRGTLEFKQAMISDPYFNALRVKFGYAITCHKAQGSEWNHVFVKCKTHQSQLTADYFRWFYTAITRTAAKLYLLDPPRLEIGGGIQAVGRPGVGMLQAASRGQSGAAPSTVSNMPEQGEKSAELHHNGDSFGIPETENFLRALLAIVRVLVADLQVRIDHIDHNQYQESYRFIRSDEFAKVNVTYGNAGKISSVTLQTPGAFGTAIHERLASLKGVPLAVHVSGAPGRFAFDQPFLNDFHARVEMLAGAEGIAIQQVTQREWCQRYHFVRGEEVAVYDVWYNGRSRFTRCQPFVTACSPGALVGDIGRLLTEGLSQ